jgi:hypothetical protein
MSMIDRCANSQCDKTLHYFREGIIYAVENSTKTSGVRAEHFWLCGKCAKELVSDERAGKRWRLKGVSKLKMWPLYREPGYSIPVAS